MSMPPLDERGLVLLAALALDWLIGDPDWLWARLSHPVVLMGRLIERLDGWLNRPGYSERARRWLGLAAIVLLVSVLGAAGWGLTALFGALPFGGALEALLAAALLAGRGLDLHVQLVAEALGTRGLEAARKAVSHIVGRDTDQLDAPGVARGAIESAAENFADGVVAPALWYLVAGLPGLLAYKAINTADSMIGYRNERYRAFGLWAARVDDAANLVPARWTGLLIAAAAGLLKLDWRRSLGSMWRDARRHASPNAGWPEAAMAGALDMALGGPRSYGGEAGDGIWLNGEASPDAGPADIARTLSVTRLASVLQAVAVALVVVAA